MTSAVQGAYGQLLSLGLLWISFHCAGMCGTLLISMDVPGLGRGHGPARGALSVLSYQAGRALTYTWLGGLMGLLGAGLDRRLASAGAGLAIGLGLLSLICALRPLRPPRPPRLAQLGLPGVPSTWTPARFIGGLLFRPEGLSRDLLLGAVMGFLPCMIAVWALGLAALTGSPLHGAMIMLLLVAMTTPTLLGVTLLPRIAVGAVLRRLGGRLPPILLGASGIHMLLIGGAALGLLPHAHLGVHVFGRGFLIMFF